MFTKRIYFFSALLFCACKRDAGALFELLPPARTGIDFNNKLAESDSLNILNYIYYYNGGGVGIADFNRDGLEDIFFTGNENACRLYLNKGNLHFEDVTQQAGLQTTQWCTGVSIADVNGDGWPDIYVCSAGYPQPERRKNLLFVNQGKQGVPVFTEAAAAYGIADTSYSTQAAFFDYDGDGDLDLYVMNHANAREKVNTPLPKLTHGEGASNDHLYRNNGNNTFTNVTLEAGILTEGYGLGIAITDVNHDGRPDVYISNDFIYNDLLYINQGGKSFTNQIDQYFKHQSYNGMGCDYADINNDARPDLMVVDMLPETDFGQKTMAGAMTWDKWQMIAQAGYQPQYMRNSLEVEGRGLKVEDSRGDSHSRPPHPPPSTLHLLPPTLYLERAQMAGVAASDWSWGPLFADFDNDGLKDLFISNGYLRDITDKDFLDYSNNLAMFKSQEEVNKELLLKIRQLKGKRLPNRVFQNAGDVTFLPKFKEWGITQESCSNGAAYADLDGDGDLDLVVNNINEAAFVYENKADKLLKNKYLNMKLEGLPANPAGIGASVTVVAGGKRQYVEQYLSRGFMSSITPVLHVGLGENTSVDTLLVHWPNGKRQILTAVPASQTLTLKEADARVAVEQMTPLPAPLMEDLSGENGLVFEHKVLTFNDFLYQPLLPHLLSENGPCLAAGDLNGDDLEDFFVGGAKGQAGALFFQKADETFAASPILENAQFEDVGAVIFDANGDGHNDLFVASGGSTGPSGSAFYQSRLYLNDGKGNFSQNIKALPAMRTPATCVAAADFDGDGDSDLFVGGSSEPGKYPLPARSYLLRNDDGVFTDVTISLAPGLEKPGIVTAAVFSEINHDGVPDLVLAGEWMPITVFLNKQGRFKDATAEMGLDKSSGWWNALTVNDLDQDGDLDIVAGNIGLNTKYRQTPQQPVTIYAKDFDQNGSTDAVMCRFTDGKEKPVHQRNELLAQIPALGKKYPRYALYAAASVQDMLGKKALSDAYFRSVSFFETACFIQENGRFKTKILPTLCQTSPINALLCSDVNGDGRPDILMTGNSLAPNVATGQYDALNGLVLLGDGAGNYHPMPLEQSGFYVPGVGKSLTIIHLKSGKKYVLAGQHAGQLKVFGMSAPTANSNDKTTEPPPN